jgi:hypothetical protein
MSIFTRIFNSVFAPASAFDTASDACATSGETTTDHEITLINPATGFAMMDGIGSIDVGGSVLGQDVHHHDYFASTTDRIFDDCSSSLDHSAYVVDTCMTFDCDWSSP